MAFAATGLSRASVGQPSCPAIHTYTTADTLATVIAANYFVDAYDKLAVNDVIVCLSDSGSDDVVTMLQVLTSTSAGVTTEVVESGGQWLYARQTAANLGTAGAVGYCVAPFDGFIRRWKTVLTTVVDGDNVLNLDVGGTNVTGSITLTASGAAAGDVDAATCTANNAVTEGAVVKIETDGGGTTGVVETWIEFIRA